MTKRKIELTWSSDGWDCELCGWIHNEQLEVTLDGTSVLELASDGHFGDGDDLDNVNEIISKILPAIGSTTVHMELDRRDDRNDVIEKALIGLGYDVTTHDLGSYDDD